MGQPATQTPFVWTALSQTLVSRFCWLLSGLLRSEMPMVQALGVHYQLGDNYYVKNIIRKIAEDIRLEEVAYRAR